ncbi:hypothetical protein AX768_08495 [Burkholderia sp. PAMC 28687]|uniref:hypothetical protein n=1 Tax=Burkholderia sp. PAMC 28687 TaxID=1795874 RepID=UPI000784ABF8|nr:hypothetical protein [Burkholderia sp. PAMC 28687]AMM14131.1 hypothetical protein AX768_08495 [Burkholderia sp. PAMC 28687]
MGATVNGTVESGAAVTLIGQAPSDASAGWMSAGQTADGKPIRTQTAVAADPQLQAYIVKNYASAAPGAVPSTVSGYTASSTQPQIGPQYDSSGSTGSVCPRGDCGVVNTTINTTVNPPTRAQLATATDLGSTAMGVAAIWLPPPFDVGALVGAAGMKSANYALSPPSSSSILYDIATTFAGLAIPQGRGVQTLFTFGTSAAQPYVIPNQK